MTKRHSPLDRAFYAQDPRLVAPGLLGAMLAHGRTVGRITETEAYLAADDPAAHAYRGRTKRTEVLFGRPGHAYVYRTRQHHCLNVVVQQEGVPGCVLVRAVEPIAGVDLIRCRRGGVPDSRLADGPAKLCQALAIDMQHYGEDLCGEGTVTIFAGERKPSEIVTTPRIGISRATDWPLRYLLAT
ncbi:MAG: DNA-3-methyladenine glycosylase [Gammaproteobacteria bacterium]|nr:DNA-3-methyladenine glycosylase [Gammaproteobacteria bacterium]